MLNMFRVLLLLSLFWEPSVYGAMSGETDTTLLYCCMRMGFYQNVTWVVFNKAFLFTWGYVYNTRYHSLYSI
ncbi:hypothetical protein F5Y17DRAFT_428081 [Xylariaceae sp. FL0594]|nr:hypothetical protein F5Y17DRAFT_428081 [Xylariaceae sp. FL0594]